MTRRGTAADLCSVWPLRNKIHHFGRVPGAEAADLNPDVQPTGASVGQRLGLHHVLR